MKCTGCGCSDGTVKNRLVVPLETLDGKLEKYASYRNEPYCDVCAEDFIEPN